MWENIKKDPFVKTIIVIILGVIAFGFAFNIMFGSGGGSMEEGSMSMGTGYSLSSTLEFIIAILIKVVIIGLLIGSIVWIFRVITKKTDNAQTEPFLWLKEDPIIRNAAIIIGSVAALVLLFSFLRGFFTPGYEQGEIMDGSSNSMYSGISINLYSILALLLNVLILLSVLGLCFGVVLYLSDHYKKFVSSNSIQNAAKQDSVCPDCKAELKGSWKCCPFCGSEKAFNSKSEKESED